MDETQIYNFVCCCYKKHCSVLSVFVTMNVSFVYKPIPKVPGLYPNSSFLLFVLVASGKFRYNYKWLQLISDLLPRTTRLQLNLYSLLYSLCVRRNMVGF
jgi:hypothetical protein